MVLFFAYYQYYLLPMLVEYTTISEQVEENEKILGGLFETERRIGLLLDEMEQLQSDIAGLEDLIPPNSKAPEIVIQLETCSNTAGVVLKNMVFDRYVLHEKAKEGANRETGYLELPIHIMVSGTYENIIFFLQQLEQSDRLYNITGFSLFTQRYDDQSLLEMSIDLSAYALSFDGRPADGLATCGSIE